MSSTYTSLHYHLVFSTKDRRPLILPEWRPALHQYMGGVVRGLDGVPVTVGGVSDHVHLLVGLTSTHALADFMRELKKAASTWAAGHSAAPFAWQEGYSAFTVSWTHITSVKQYIAGQEQHHARTSCMTELKRLLKKNGVQYDPKYLL